MMIADLGRHEQQQNGGWLSLDRCCLAWLGNGLLTTSALPGSYDVTTQAEPGSSTPGLHEARRLWQELTRVCLSYYKVLQN